MMHKIFLAVAFFAFPLSAQASDLDKTLATVNGTPIKQSFFDQYAAEWRKHKKAKRSNDTSMLSELIQIELIRQEALKQGVDKDPAILKELEFITMKLYIREVTRRAMADHPISEEMVQAKYAQLLATSSLKEYKAKHILSKEKETAEAIIAELNSGKDFSALAKEKSIDSSARSGGDLGWFNQKGMDAKFIAAVQSLTKSTYTQEPVQSDYGWHVILLEDTRQATLPALTKVKKQLVNMLKGEYLQRYLKVLHDQAQIDIVTSEPTP